MLKSGHINRLYVTLQNFYDFTQHKIDVLEFKFLFFSH